MSSPTKAPDIRWKRLQNNCEVTLERFTASANETCSMISRLRSLAVSKDKRLEIFLQQKREDEALYAYRKARQELVSVLESDPEAVDSIPEAAPPRSYSSPRVGRQRRPAG